MSHSPTIEEQRSMAAVVLRQGRDEIVRRWLQRVRLLTRERGVDRLIREQVLRDEASEFMDTLLARLEGHVSDGDVAVFYHLILDGQQYRVRLADIAYVLIELKSVSKQVIFEKVDDELDAFRISRLVDDSIEAVLRKSADLYELTTAADHKTAQERLQEVFAAWDIEEALASAQTLAEVRDTTAKKLAVIWELVGLRISLCAADGEGPRDLPAGRDLPMPLIDQAAGGAPSAVTPAADYVTARRQSFICEDLGRAGNVPNARELLNLSVASLACVPLVARGEVVGAMLLYGARAGTFLESDARRLRDFAGVLALALDRAGRLERSRREITEAEVIARIGRSLLELPTREELLEGVCEAMRAFRDYFDVSLFVVDEEAGLCRLMAEAGSEARFLPRDYTQPIEQGLIGACACGGATIRSTDLAGDPRRIVAFAEEYRARSELAVAMRKGGRVLGVIHFLSERQDDFPPSEVAAIEHVAPHIGIALENARMIQQRSHDRYEIEQAHRQLASIVRSASVGITSSDRNGVYTDWSPSCETMLGYGREEMIDRRTARDLAAEPYDLSVALEECMREGSLTAERRLLRKDGRARVIRETRLPMEDERGEHAGFISYLVDITEQKRAEEQLRHERDTLNLVVDAMGAGLALFDADIRLQWANSTLMDWFDLGPDAIGKDCHAVQDCGRGHGEECPLRRAAATGHPTTNVVERTDENGVWHCFQQVCTPLSHGDTQLVVLTFDITDQRRQTEQMRLINKLAEKVETTLDLGRVCHLVLTCMTAGHAIGFNRAFMFLISEEDQCLAGRAAVGPVSVTEAHRIWRGLDQQEHTIDQLLDSATPSEGDTLLTERIRGLCVPLADEDCALVRTLNTRTSAHVGDARTDPLLDPGLTRTLGLEEFACVALAVQDQPIGVVVADNAYSGVPISTEQVELLEMFSRQASLAVANALAYERISEQLVELQRTRTRLIEAERLASVGRMASHLAHEIRNPLTAIGGFAGSIGRQHSADPATYRKAKIIFDEVKRLERTLVNVLDYTRPLRPNRQPLDVNDVVRETTEQFQSQIAAADVNLVLSLRDDVPAIMADGSMIKQVIINLVKNALEALENRRNPKLEISTEPRDGSVRIVVADNGIGMEQETANELFSPFFTTKIGGIGVGLSVSQRIARQHGGDIVAETRLGEGSRFTVDLAVDDRVSPAEQPVGGTGEQSERKG